MKKNHYLNINSSSFFVCFSNLSKWRVRWNFSPYLWLFCPSAHKTEVYKNLEIIWQQIKLNLGALMFLLGYGGRCRDMRCASSEQCIGFYETCNKGQVEGTDCGSYPTCVAKEGDVVHSAPSPSSSMYSIQYPYIIYYGIYSIVHTSHSIHCIPT